MTGGDLIVMDSTHPGARRKLTLEDMVTYPLLHCVKLMGRSLMARVFDRQVAEFQVRVAVLNGYTAPGIPVKNVVG